jgi:F-type H+-transporting ATPase subunit gamma
VPSLRETKNRIRSVKNTEKITKAMKMVAASKLRRAQEAVLRPRPYTQKLGVLISALAERVTEDATEGEPLLLDRPIKNRIEILALSSDRGLCGALNSSVVRMTQRFLVDHVDDFKDIAISTIGKKGFEGLSRLGLKIRKRYEPNSKATFDLNLASHVADELCERFLSGEIDGVYLIYNQFKSALTQTVMVEQLLPIERPKIKKEALPDYIYEPNKKELLRALVPRYFATKLYQSFLESYASEQGARMTAMDNATRNAKEMTEKLTLQYNRARQAAITKELVEIISGAEAL